MDLQEIYKEESGFDVGRYNIDNTNYYSEDYVEWLEKHLRISNVTHCTLECGNENPPCAPNLKFGMLECAECDWGE